MNESLSAPDETEAGALLWNDDELAALAMSADSSVPFDEDAVPWTGAWQASMNVLPEWYMPRAVAVGRGRGTKVVIIAVIAGFVIINAFGLCITSGFLSFA
jgi:hypothetical protein